MQRILIVAGVIAVALCSLPAAAGGDAGRGKAKAAEVCAACHGPTGMSPSPEFPNLAGQYPDYLVKALRDYRSGARNDPIMAGFAATLSDADMEDLAAWFSMQEGALFTPPLGTN